MTISMERLHEVLALAAKTHAEDLTLEELGDAVLLL